MKSWGYALVAGLAVLVVIAGVGGYMLGVSNGRTQASDVRRQFLAERLGTGNNPAGAGLSARPMTSGTVKSVDGNTVTVTTRNGEVKVELAGDTVINKMGPGTTEDIQPGLRITVMGDASSSGVVTARSVQLASAGSEAPWAPSAGQ